MRRIITFIRNIIYLKKVIKNPSIVSENQLDMWFKHIFNSNVIGLERKYLLKAIKSLRNLYPYKTGQYDEAKDLYEDYFKLKNSISSYEELSDKIEQEGVVYITKFRKDVPVRCKKYSSRYYINYSGSKENKVFEIRRIEEFNRENLTCFLYSTMREIINYKVEQKRKQKVKELIDLKQKEIQNLYKEL